MPRASVQAFVGKSLRTRIRGEEHRRAGGKGQARVRGIVGSLDAATVIKKNTREEEKRSKRANVCRVLYANDAVGFASWVPRARA